MIYVSSVFLIWLSLVFSAIGSLSQLIGFVFFYFFFRGDVGDVVWNELSPQSFIGELSDFIAKKRIVFLKTDKISHIDFSRRLAFFRVDFDFVPIHKLCCQRTSL